MTCTEFTLAMVNYNSSYTSEGKMTSPAAKSERNEEDVDLTMFVVYDHRVNNSLEKITKNLFGDVLGEINNLFVPII
jgi:hypothetical protein